MYGLLCSVPLFLWGYYSINAGLNSDHAGPIIGGTLSLFFGLLLAVTSALHLIDKIWPVCAPVLTDCDQERSNREYQERRMAQHWAARDDALETIMITQINTPDPNLVHPDDLKRIYAEYGSSNLPPQHEHQGQMVFGQKAIEAYQPKFTATSQRSRRI